MLDQTPVQIAWVTHDLDVTEGALSAMLGARSWVRMNDVHFAPEACSYLGAPADFTAHVSFSYAGDTQLEVIQPVAGRGVYSDFLAASGPGLHHVCLAAPDAEAFEAMVVGAERDGIDVIGRGTMPGGMRFAYVAAADAGVPCIELAYIPPDVQKFFDHVKQEQL
ncbi:VOC family protein [Mycolicibacterium sediminis]|nr:VOC family protein [Mycolicibacterium sediminis]